MGMHRYKTVWPRRVSLMRELFQCGKPLPIEDLCGEDEANRNVPSSPVYV